MSLDDVDELGREVNRSDVLREALDVVLDAIEARGRRRRGPRPPTPAPSCGDACDI